MKVKFGVFSLSASAADGDDSRYLRWHHLDHLPQQYEVAGLLYGQRWVSTPECLALRPVQSERFEPVNHVVHYLFGEPVAQAVDDFFAFRDHLIEIGRFPEWLPNRLVSGGEPVEVHAAPSASVTAEVVPYRPNRGAYLVIEQCDPPGDSARWSAEHVERAARHRRCRRVLVVRAHHAAARRVQQERVQRHRVLSRRRPAGGRRRRSLPCSRTAGSARRSSPRSPHPSCHSNPSTTSATSNPASQTAIPASAHVARYPRR